MDAVGALVPPPVSVVLPTLNERTFIRDCIDSLARQDYPNIIELLVVDGGSIDGTREIVSKLGGTTHLLDNPRTTAAAAMNIGIAASIGEVICRADAHTLYAPDYVSRCVDVLLNEDADNVGGPMRPVGSTPFGKAVAAVTSSAFGIGPGRFHYSTKRESVDTVYLGCFRRSTLHSLGGYDESSLQWAAEDHELNFRICRRGGRVVLDPSIRSWYLPRESWQSLARQYRNYGIAKASTLAKHRRLPSWRPLAPAGLVAATVAGALRFRGWRRALPPLVHAIGCGVIAMRLARQPGVAPHRAFGVIQTCHWTYGVGFWSGVARIVLGKPFDTRPNGHR